MNRKSTLLLLFVCGLVSVRTVAEPVPVELCRFNDLYGFRKTAPGKAETGVTISRDNDNVYVAIDCREPIEVVAKATDDGYDVWQSDNVEIFFGSMGEHPWFRQFVVGAGGARHSIHAELSDWSAKVIAEKSGWKAYVTIPIRVLGQYQDGMRFNILRGRKKGGELQTWSNIFFGHDVERYREIPFSLPDDYAIHGPWLFQPGTTQIGIGWESAKPCAAKLEYREKGAGEFKIYNEPRLNGIMRGDHKLHKVWLTNLKPDTEYEYRIAGASGSFRTLKDKPSDFSAFVTADLHDRPSHMEKVLRHPAVQDCDFAVYLGDMLTSSLDKWAYYDGFLDTSVKNWEKPFVYIRGNHEYRGRAAGVYFDMFGSPENKGYFTFQHGGVLFIALDLEGESDYPVDGRAYYEEQRGFLERVAASPEFKNADFRVVMGHVPPLSPALDGKIVAEYMKMMPDGSIDVFIGGHKHTSAYVPPGSSKIISGNPARFDKRMAYGMDFHVLLCDYGGIVKIERKGDVLNFTTKLDKFGKELQFSSFSVRKKSLGKK